MAAELLTAALGVISAALSLLNHHRGCPEHNCPEGDTCHRHDRRPDKKP